MGSYWDTSCVLKLYCPESDSKAWIDRLGEAREPPRSSSILELELIFAFHQKALRGETGGTEPETLLGRFQRDLKLGLFQLYPLGDDIIGECQRIARQCYIHSRPIPLRTLDGIHLATALKASCRELVTTDERMRAAAQLLGLATPAL